MKNSAAMTLFPFIIRIFALKIVVMNAIFTKSIVDWYAENQRKLPWRETKLPYAIWISEIILQQTRVAQGYDYYLRFMQRFPTVQDLASASEDEVLLMWQGLGYYSRARNLHKAARQIVEMGGFPSDYTALLALPGIGEYTAAAISSFAYGLPHAVLDGNVFRVLSRYFGVDTPIDSTQGKKLFRALADEMLDRNDSATYNQAIMDFGALVCTPHASCSSCPLSETCAAFRANTVDELPVKSHVTKVRPRHLIYLYICVDGKILLHRRGEGDIWQGLYEPVLLELKADEQESFAERLCSLFPDAVLLDKGRKHQLSHQLLIADFYVLNATSPAEVSEKIAQLFPADSLSKDFFWTPETSLDEYASPRLLLEFYKKRSLCR